MNKEKRERYTTGEREFILTASVHVLGFVLAEMMGAGFSIDEFSLLTHREWERAGEVPELLDVAKKHGIAERKQQRLIDVAKQEVGHYIRIGYPLPTQKRRNNNYG